MVREIVLDKLDILMIFETKGDPSFPSSQFVIEGFSSLFRLDRNSLGGNIMLFITEEIPSKLLSEYKTSSSVENKWLISCSCNANLTQINCIKNISRSLDFYSS